MKNPYGMKIMMKRMLRRQERRLKRECAVTIDLTALKQQFMDDMRSRDAAGGQRLAGYGLDSRSRSL